ncbi:ABC transporter ATP-binding protein [Clostridium folliculivorans]|uniref:ABC transporter ATP-binding protein n=1 Tax=Clostridium folliculivorans TaxID=2886038 RepID=A0A9W5XYT0_9CLOT|nr:ABC transporter ATP-binding protein [Clostridium folliculivorans]GKU23381.1 ABC transporter ATP-binding protein [Clostridium folliculivorans]GKU29498.1 ABC transporter ATP-binding protein [Clostridium folliculivorans]
MGSLKWIWSYLKRYKLKYFIALFMVLIASALNMINPFLSGKIVDKVIGGGDKKILISILLMMIGVSVMKAIDRYIFQMIFEFVSQDVIFQIREDLYKKLLKMDFEYYNNTRTGDLMARMTGDTDAIRHFVAWVVYNVFENLTLFIFAVVMMFTVNVKLTIALILITPIIGFLATKMTKEVGPTFYAIRESFSKLNSVVQENISGNRVVKAFAKEKYEIEKFSEANEDYKFKNLKSAKVWEKYLPVLDSLAGVLSVIMMLIGGIMVVNGTMTMGDLVVFNGFIWALNNPMRMAGWLINDFERYVASTYKIRDLLNAEVKIKSQKEKQTVDGIRGDIKFENVSFSYENEEILNDISFEINAGQTIGILGPTGAGKSTLVNLICRFYDVTKGKIEIDGVDIRKLDIIKLRDRIAVAMQDIFLFSDTIEGNIAYGRPEATFEQVQRVANVAGAHEFIVNMPEGYDTIIGERGVGLSGGQKQRIALARALLKNPSILILDDTTSSVDMETELKIHKELRSIYKNRTNFIIAHRISSVKSADLILVLDDGKVIERGTHEELLKKRGYYYSVYANQFGDFDVIRGAV